MTGLSYSVDGDLDPASVHGDADMWLLKLDQNGDIVWQKAMGGALYDVGYSVAQTLDGGYIVAGYTKSHDGDLSVNIGGQDVWIVKLSSLGTVEWENIFGGTLDDEADCVAQTADGNYIVAGYTKSNNLDVNGNHGASDFWVVKFSDPIE